LGFYKRNEFVLLGTKDPLLRYFQTSSYLKLLEQKRSKGNYLINKYTTHYYENLVKESVEKYVDYID